MIHKNRKNNNDGDDEILQAVLIADAFDNNNNFGPLTSDIPKVNK